jgi:hypothetical protein
MAMIRLSQQLSEADIGFLKLLLSFVQALWHTVKHLILHGDLLAEILPLNLDGLYDSMYLIKLIVLLTYQLFLLLDQLLIVLPTSHGVFTLVVPRPLLFLQIDIAARRARWGPLRESDLHLSLGILEVAYGLLHTFQSLLHFFHAPTKEKMRDEDFIHAWLFFRLILI